MKIIENPHQAFTWVTQQRAQGKSVGLVPTMGALHAGHIALVEQSVEECDVTIATIFVNPTQFSANEDLSKYPRTTESDCELLRNAGCDALFLPSQESIYPEGFSTYVEPPKVSQVLEGMSRPTHFRGVTTVVLKLFNLLPATHAYFGRKDYQQVLVIRQMAEDLAVPIRVVACDIVRDSDGLALSSRNRYLSDAERASALSIRKALLAVQEAVYAGETSTAALEQLLKNILDLNVSSIEYAVLADADTLSPSETVGLNSVALVAARVGSTRLIDNLVIAPPPSR